MASSGVSVNSSHRCGSRSVDGDKCALKQWNQKRFIRSVNDKPHALKKKNFPWVASEWTTQGGAIVKLKEVVSQVFCQTVSVDRLDELWNRLFDYDILEASRKE